jgi:isopenicillin-N epimerase
MSANWAAARVEMLLDPTIINLNTGSFGPLPRRVFERVTQIRAELAAEPTHFFVRTQPSLLWQAREALASFLGTSPERLIFAVNVSAAINLVAASLKLAAPGEILLTDHEYGAMYWCWERAAIRQGMTLRTFALPTMAHTPAEVVAAAAAAMSSKTRLFFFSHVLSPTGLVLPAQELCAEARKRGILTVVDGAHAPAMLPLDIDAIGADFYTGNCHKWLLAPTGSGFLVFGRGNEDRLQPLQVSWGYHFERGQIDQRDEFGSTPRLRHLEFEGTRDTCPWLAVPEAIAFQTEIGWEQIRGHIAELAEHSRQQMGRKVGLPLATPAESAMHGALTAFELPVNGPEKAIALRQAIWRHRIEVPIIERSERLLIRLSTHFYNTEGEIDRLTEVLPDALKRTAKL